MGDQKSHDIAEIEELLGVRQQLTGWLEKLDVAGSKAPESVRAKVRSDYRARLTQIVAQLGTHADVIASTLDGLRAQRREFEQGRAEEFEVRAEAELRHSVGEYSDDEWQLVELESSGKIEGFDQELTRIQGEISRLEEVQGLIQPAPQRSAPPPPSRPEPILVTHEPDMPPMLSQDPLAPTEQPALTLVRDDAGPAAPLPRPEAPRFVPRPGTKRDSGPVRQANFPQVPAQQVAPGQPQDELAFIRSVSLDSAPASPRVTQPAPSAVGSDKEDRPNQASARTLKCGECGSLNRPTEWYCERCGAELAAL